MAYTPELSLCSSRTLRRIAWALGIPMTKAIEEVLQYIPRSSQQFWNVQRRRRS
jgi:hypothetical protein